MSEQPRHEALVAAAILGVVKSKGWMQVPFVVDVNRAIEAAQDAGGVAAMNRWDAVQFTRGLIDKACDVEDWPRPEFSPEEERIVSTLFGLAYDRLVEAETAA